MSWIDGAQDNVVDWLSNVSSTGFSYLSGISAVIAAVLPLTAIIFAQYYDRSAERSNELFWDIREKLLNNKLDAEEVRYVQLLFKKMVYVGANKVFFLVTLHLFRWVSYILAFTWLLVAIGYILEYSITNEASLSQMDITTTTFSTALLLIVFLGFPTLFSHVRKRVPIIIEKNGCSLSNFANIVIDERITKEFICNNLINLKLEIPTRSKQLEFNYSFDIPINQYDILWDITSKNNESIMIKLSIDKIAQNNKYNLNYKIDQSRKCWRRRTEDIENPKSLISIFDNINSDLSRVYLVSKDKEKSVVFTGEVKSHVKSGVITLDIAKCEHNPPSGKSKLIYEGGNMIDIRTTSLTKRYNLVANTK